MAIFNSYDCSLAKLQRLFCLGTILRKPDWRFYPNLIGGDQHGCSHSFITFGTHTKNYGTSYF